MKVLMLIPHLPFNLNKIKGGIESATLNLLEGFIDIEIKIRVVVITKEIKATTIINFSDNIELHYEYEGDYKYHSINYLINSPVTIKKHISIFKPDIIHYQIGNSFLFTKFIVPNEIKIVQTIHGMSLMELKNKKALSDKIKWLFNGLLQNILCPKNIIHLSTFSKQFINRRNVFKEEIIHNSITNEFFEIKSKNMTENKLIYIGIINENKNLLYLLDVLSALIKLNYKYTLEIVGGFTDENYKKEILNFVIQNDLNDHIIFNGQIDKNAVKKKIEEADILIVCSKHESLPMVIAECMSAGKVVIASNVGGIKEMIQDLKTGYLFKLSNKIRLIEILKQLYNNNQECLTLSNQARLFAKDNYNCKNVAKKTALFYEEIVEKKKSNIRFIKKFYFFKVEDNWFKFNNTINNIFKLKTYSYIPIQNGNKYCIKEKGRTSIIDLNKSIEEIANKFRSTTRNSIKKAETINVKCVYNIDIKEFYSFYKQFAVQKKIYPIPIKIMVENKNHLIITAAKINDSILAAHSYVIDETNGIARLYQSASKRLELDSDKNLISHANKLLTYKNIELFKKMNLRHYDFGGLSDNKKLNGINEFKMSFGGEIIEQYNYHSFPYYILKKLSTLLDKRYN